MNFVGSIVPEVCQHCACGWGGFFAVIQNVLRFGLYLGIFFAVLIIAYAGFLLVTNPASPGNIEEAKGKALSAVIGLVVILGAWLIINTVLVGLGAGSVSSVSAIFSTVQPTCLSFSPPPTPSTGGLTTTPGAPTAVGGNEDTVRQELSAAGVSVNKAACPASAGTACGGTPPSCTNVGGMQSATVSQVIALANACSGCGLVVTGGSEPGHACGTYSHGNGYKVDIRPSSGLDSLLQSLTSVGTRTGDGPGPAYSDSCGNQYVRESDHWDITVTGVCTLTH
jgi:hypothetical protein